MVPVASLLNPSPPPFERLRDTCDSASSSSRQPSPYPSPLLPLKKQKMPKGAATIMKGNPKGEVNYPPHEIQDITTAAEHHKYEVQPLGEISDYPRRIPYNSDKKTFREKTGRDGFEVYQYTFRMPGDDRDKDPHCVMWDYNIGLVRITALFKSLNHPKTMPAKVMSANPGLRDVSHSITGGSISAQGYWVPFEAAKAVAARLCYDIRYVLVPVFGPDFVAMCHNRDDPDFQNLSVDWNIIQRCKEGATALQLQSRESSTASSPCTPSAYTSLPLWPPPKSSRPKPKRAADVESGYGTDTDRSDIYPSSPGSPTSISFTPVNTPRTPTSQSYQLPLSTNITSTPRLNVFPVRSPVRKTSKRARTNDKTPDTETASYQSAPEAPALPKRRKVSPTTSNGMLPEIGAAYTLIQLNKADATVTEKKDLRHRRASA